MITDIAHVTEGRLCWPETKPRTGQRDKGPFRGHSIDDRTSAIRWELERWNVREWILSRNRNRIFAGDPAVALWWLDRKKQLRVLACDRYQTQANNAHAIYLTLDAMRALERWGAYTAEQAAEGARLALPPPSGPVMRQWWEVIPGVQRGWPLPAIEGMYRDTMKRVADEPEEMRHLNAAIEQARKEKNGG